MHKKGVAITFNWILVLVAGGLILGFLVWFAFSQVRVDDTRQGIEAAVNIDFSLDALLATEEATRPIALSRSATLAFSCEDIIVNGQFRSTDKIVFAPITFTNDFFVSTRTLEFPFKIDNLFYATNDRVRFFIANNPRFLDQLPPSMRAFALTDIQLVQAQSQNAERVVLVYFDQTAPDILIPNAIK